MTQIVCHITAISAQIDPSTAKRALPECWETKIHPLTCTVVLLSSLHRVLLLFTKWTNQGREESGHAKLKKRCSFENH